MRTVPWQALEHLPLLERWLDERGMPVAHGRYDLYPEHGVLVDGRLFGFVFLTDAPGLAYLDCAVGDPAASAEDIRDSAIELVRALRELATKHGAKVVFANTNIPCLVAACRENGFTEHTRRLHCMAFTEVS